MDGGGRRAEEVAGGKGWWMGGGCGEGFGEWGMGVLEGGRDGGWRKWIGGWGGRVKLKLTPWREKGEGGA